MIRSVQAIAILALTLSLGAKPTHAQTILTDQNGDGAIEITAFGDSITYGVGDGTEPGQYVSTIDSVGEPRGWPKRLSTSLGLSVLNAGSPGEQVVAQPNLTDSGVQRFPDVVIGSSADVVIIKEGANDAQHAVTSAELATSIQKMLNIARADNKKVVLSTLAPPTVQHAQFAPAVIEYSSAVRDLAVMNNVPIVDIAQGFLLACPDLSVCPYYNLPEGLHPNTAGYDAIAQMYVDTFQK
jgi:lysophospholipase L1-like esterase